MQSCNNDEPNRESVDFSKGKVSKTTLEMINVTFPGLRIDSMGSYSDHSQRKMEYDGPLLTKYSELYKDGSVHDGVSFTLEYSLDTVYIKTIGGALYKGVIGKNGLVCKLICPNGKENVYKYNKDNQLLSYDVDIADKEDLSYYKLEWENGNIIRRYRVYPDPSIYHGNDTIRSIVSYYYTNTPNKGSVLPSQEGWIHDEGKSYAYGINDVLYYAGLLGPSSRLLLEYANSWSIVTQKEKKYTYSYKLYEDGYVKSDGTYDYFYLSK